MSPRSYLNELSPTRGVDPATGRAQPRPPVIAPTLGQGFDVTTVGFVAQGFAVAGTTKYPSIPILEVAEQIERAEVLNLAVIGDPFFMWANNLWWSLTIRTGPLQEWAPTASIDPTDTGVAALAPTVVGGVRYSSYGSLANPKPIRIRLAARSVLSLQLYARGTSFTTANGRVPINVYIRSVGIVHYSRVGA